MTSSRYPSAHLTPTMGVPAQTKLTLAAKPRELTPLDPARMRLSVLVPIYNERNTIETILDRVHASPVRKEIICVDDYSTDGTRDFVQRLAAEGRPGLKVSGVLEVPAAVVGSPSTVHTEPS